MNLEVIRPCLVATRRVFQRVLGADLRLGRPQAVPSLQLESDQEQSFAALSINGAHEGLLLLIIPADTHTRLADHLAKRSEQPSGNGQVIIELMDWVRSAVRADLKRLNIAVESVQPTGVSGMQTRLQAHGPWITFPASSTFGQLRLAYGPPRPRAVERDPLQLSASKQALRC